MAYIGRKRFEAQLIASEVGKLFSGASAKGSGTAGQSKVIGKAKNGDDVVSADTMLGMLG